MQNKFKNIKLFFAIIITTITVWFVADYAVFGLGKMGVEVGERFGAEAQGQISVVINSSQQAHEETFTHMGPGGEGFLSRVRIDPNNSDVAYFCGDNCGIYKTINGGDTWVSITTGLGNYKVPDIIIHPSNSNVLWAATRGGVYKSTDAGATWTAERNGWPAMSQTYPQYNYDDTTTIAINPYDTNVIFAGCGGTMKFRTRTGLEYIGFKSTDAGESWSPIPNGSGGPSVGSALVITSFSFKDANTIYMGSNQGLYKSTNGGTTWSNISTPYGFIHKVEYVNPSLLYVACASSATGSTGGFYKSTDGGSSWTNLNPSQYAGKRGRFFKVLSDDGQTVMCSFYSRIHLTTDGGSSWTNWGIPVIGGWANYSGSAVFGFDALSDDLATLYSLYHVVVKTEDSGATWKSCYTKSVGSKWQNTGFVNSVTHGLLIDPDNSDVIMIGDLDASISVSTDAGDSWGNYHTHIGSLINSNIADCYSLAKDSRSGIYYAIVGDGGSDVHLVKSTDTTMWTQVKSFSRAYHSTVAVAEHDNVTKLFVTQYLSSGGIWSSINGGANWVKTDIGNGYITEIIQDPNSSGILYATLGYETGASSNGGLYRSTDFGSSWSKISSADMIDCWSVTVKPGDSQTILVAARGYKKNNKGGVYRTTNGGSSWIRVDDSIIIEGEDSGTSRKRWAKSIRYTQDGGIVCIGYTDQLVDPINDKGLYYSTDDGNNWAKAKIPIGSINIIAANLHNSSQIMVGTEGGGSFMVDFDSDTTPPTISNPSPSTTLPAGTTQTTISLTTNESATCRYSTTPNIPYASITNTFSTTGGTTHSQTITGLSDGNSYNYYVRCIDEAGNPNTDDFNISFSIASSPSPTTYNILNFAQLIIDWLATAISTADLNNDGVVNTRDLGIIMSNWEG